MPGRRKVRRHANAVRLEAPQEGWDVWLVVERGLDEPNELDAWFSLASALGTMNLCLRARLLPCRLRAHLANAKLELDPTYGFHAAAPIVGVRDARAVVAHARRDDVYVIAVCVGVPHQDELRLFEAELLEVLLRGGAPLLVGERLARGERQRSVEDGLLHSRVERSLVAELGSHGARGGVRRKRAADDRALLGVADVVEDAAEAVTFNDLVNHGRGGLRVARASVRSRARSLACRRWEAGRH